MLLIYKAILSLYKDEFKDASQDFKLGFEACIIMLKKGIKSTPQFNVHIQLNELEKDYKKLRAENLILKNTINNQREVLKNKSLISDNPTAKFKTYELNSNFGYFTIVINAEKETVLAAYIKFLSQTKYHSADECKSKFMTFLHKLKSKEFRVYKDMKTAKKEEIANDSRKN